RGGGPSARGGSVARPRPPRPRGRRPPRPRVHLGHPRPGRVPLGVHERRPAGGGGTAVRRVVHCTLAPEPVPPPPPHLLPRPAPHDLARAPPAVVNVRRANVDVESGVAWFLLELSGPEDELARAEAWLAGDGGTVEPIDAWP